MAEVVSRSVQKIYQLSVFLENRVGILLKVCKLLEAQGVRICGLNVVDTADTAIVRLIVDQVLTAKRALKEQGLSCYETPLLGVEVPIEKGIDVAAVLGILLRGEVNVHYVHTLIGRVNRNPVLAFHVDNPELAARLLLSHDLHLVTQDDIRWEED